MMTRNMRFGIQVPNTGGSPPDTEKTVDTCCKKTNVKANPMPMKMWTPTPRAVFLEETLSPKNERMMMPKGLAIRLCRSI